MPTYEYLCKECGFKFEEFQSIAAEPLHVCPKCKGSIRRLISGGGGIIFKGSGFYETDYKKKSFREATPSSSETKESVSTPDLADKEPQTVKEKPKTEKKKESTKS